MVELLEKLWYVSHNGHENGLEKAKASMRGCVPCLNIVQYIHSKFHTEILCSHQNLHTEWSTCDVMLCILVSCIETDQVTVLTDSRPSIDDVNSVIAEGVVDSAFSQRPHSSLLTLLVFLAVILIHVTRWLWFLCSCFSCCCCCSVFLFERHAVWNVLNDIRKHRNNVSFYQIVCMCVQTVCHFRGLEPLWILHNCVLTTAFVTCILCNRVCHWLISITCLHHSFLKKFYPCLHSPY